MAKLRKSKKLFEGLQKSSDHEIEMYLEQKIKAVIIETVSDLAAAGRIPGMPSALNQFDFNLVLRPIFDIILKTEKD